MKSSQLRGSKDGAVWRLRRPTAMLSKPGLSCFRVKFSSANDFVPKMLVLPVPSPLIKSPPWIMKFGI
jgi:hypothetical protein